MGGLDGHFRVCYRLPASGFQLGQNLTESDLVKQDRVAAREMSMEAVLRGAPGALQAPVEQAQARQRLMSLFRQTPLPPAELATNLGLYLRSTLVAKMLYLNELYTQILPLPGVVMEFGCWWGSNLALFSSLRAIHEPYNYARRVVGFDSFAGYQSVSQRDGSSPYVTEGAYAVASDYLPHLQAVLDCHEADNPMSHLKKYELVAGDVTETVPGYFQRHPECVVALAYLDMQLYEPTKAALQGILPHLVSGSVVAIDELNCPDFPGETQAVAEVLGFRRHRFLRSKFLPDRTYVVME